MNPTCKYELHLDDEAEMMLMGHAVFLAKDNPSASVKLIDIFDECLDKIEANPLVYQFADERDVPGIPPKTYRRCIFKRYYKIVYRVDGQMIKVTAVIDARAENKGLFGNATDQADEPAGA